MRQRGAVGVTTVEQLLSSKTFLGGLSEAERASILGTEPRNSSVRSTGPHSPRTEAAALAGAAAAASWEACLDAAEARQCSPNNSCRPSKQQLLLYQQHLTDLDSRQQLQLQQQQRPATAGAGTSSSPAAVAGWDALRQQSHVLLADNEQLQRDSRLLQKQKEQLQAKITGLQNQVTMLLASQRLAADGSSKLAALEGVIGRLQATLSHISSMAGKAAQENKVLLCENQQLAAERARLQEALQQMKARIRELEADLLVKIAASSQEAADAAAAAAAADPLLLLPGRGDLVGAAASSSSLTAGSAGVGKIGPALQEIAALKRSRDALRREVARLQQQLSAAERDAQAAAAAAAAERARAARNGGQGQNRLAAAIQRLEAVTAREQQQAATLHEREEYIARLEQCLLDQHKQLSQLAAAASKGRRTGAAAAAADLSVQLQEVAKIPPAAAAAQVPVDSQRSSSAGGAGAVASAVAGEAPGSSSSSSRPGSPAAASRMTPGEGVGKSSPTRSIAELQVKQQLLQQQWRQQQQQQQAQLGMTSAISTPGHTHSLMQQRAAAAERGRSQADAAAAAERAAVAKQCRDMQLRASGGRTCSGSELSPTAAAAAAASPPKEPALSPRQMLQQQRHFMPMRYNDDFQESRQQQQQQQQQLRGLQRLQSSKLQHWQQQQQQHHDHSAGSLRRTANAGGGVARGASGAATTNSSNGSTLKGTAGTGSTGSIRRGNNGSNTDGNKTQGISAGKRGSPVAAAVPGGVKTSQLHQLHMQRRRRLRELLQQKQQRQQQRLQPVLQPQRQQRGLEQEQHVEDGTDIEEAVEPYPSEQAVPAPVAGMQLRPVPQDQQQQQDQWLQRYEERAAQADWQQMQQQLQQQQVDSDSTQHAAGWAAQHSQLSPRRAAAPAHGLEQSNGHLQHMHQQQQHAMQEPSLASGLGLAAADVAAACIGSPGRRFSMQPAYAAAASTAELSSCYSPAAAHELQTHCRQLAGLLPAQLSVGISHRHGGVSDEDEAAAAYEARLVAKVLEMERSMQALESQLMHVGCSDTE